jgi:flavin-dependent thymidylate synthase
MPKVTLLDYTKDPFKLAVASARTCYSSKLVLPEDVSAGQLERIGVSIFEAGHHTPYQHPTFVFGIEDVSRQCVWSFLHNHPFYNSDQQSQRYVSMDEVKVFVPKFSDEGNREIYMNAVGEAWKAYSELSEILKEDNFVLMERIGKIKDQTEKQIRVDSEKKAIEMARYVVPVAATCNLHHTVSAVTLFRYKRMMNACDCPAEAKEIVDQMIAEVEKIDPEFIEKIGEETLGGEEMIENLEFEKDEDFAVKFDRDLDGKIAKLVSFDSGAEKLVADQVREVLGVSVDDDEAIDLLVNPAKNKYLMSTLNAYAHSPLMRILNNVYYVFKKKISHTADSQDQRHRMVPACRPMLSKTHTEKPDFEIPFIVGRNEQAKEIYERTMQMLWDAKNKLIANGVDASDACYLLPNAVNLRFTQSGSLLNFLHKWRLRTCFNAQLEIYDSSIDEIKQVSEVHPRLVKYVGPPCLSRHKAGIEGHPCPEGPRWCGISVWMNFPNVKRPF